MKEENKNIEKNNFDLVSDDSDHRFLKQNISDNCFTDTKNSVYKRIMKEWKILQENLPDSIYVKAYERRIDLLRAVIIGAAGTPYHDGLFFFDIQFPSDYPINPPLIHYYSFGYNLNPNLYTNGSVCLSLLNTWSGKKSEKWDPSKSTILQVLVSIQALVLNENPLFNEPGYRILKRSIFETKSRAYNDDAFVFTCHLTVALNRCLKPLKHFEDFVKEHFKERGPNLLAACKEYANGRVRTGYYGYNGHNKNSNEKISRRSLTVINVTERFQASLRLVYRNMYKQFLESGAFLEGFGKELEVEIEKVKEKRSSNGGGGGMLKKAMGKIKLALGWRKKKMMKKKKST